MSMSQTETFEWMHKRIYQELEPEVARLNAKIVELTLALAQFQTQELRDKSQRERRKSILNKLNRAKF